MRKCSILEIGKFDWFFRSSFADRTWSCDYFWLKIPQIATKTLDFPPSVSDGHYNNNNNNNNNSNENQRRTINVYGFHEF